MGFCDFLSFVWVSIVVDSHIHPTSTLPRPLPSCSFLSVCRPHLHPPAYRTASRSARVVRHPPSFLTLSPSSRPASFMLTLRRPLGRCFSITFVSITSAAVLFVLCFGRAAPAFPIYSRLSSDRRSLAASSLACVPISLWFPPALCSRVVGAISFSAWGYVFIPSHTLFCAYFSGSVAICLRLTGRVILPYLQSWLIAHLNTSELIL